MRLKSLGNFGSIRTKKRHSIINCGRKLKYHNTINFDPRRKAFLLLHLKDNVKCFSKYIYWHTGTVNKFKKYSFFSINNNAITLTLS